MIINAEDFKNITTREFFVSLLAAVKYIEDIWRLCR